METRTISGSNDAGAMLRELDRRTPKPRRSVSVKRSIQMLEDYGVLNPILHELGQGVKVPEFMAISGLSEERVRAALKYVAHLGFMHDMGAEGWVDGSEAEKRGLVLVQNPKTRQCLYVAPGDALRRGFQICS